MVGARGAESQHRQRELGERGPEASSSQTRFSSVGAAAYIAKASNPVKGRCML